MTKTFAELAIPFPLFEASVDQAMEYCGETDCSLCGKAGQHCFTLGIGAALIVECPNCGARAGLDADDRENEACDLCGATILFPCVEEEEITACYTCLRSGRAALTKDTVLGMVSWDEEVTESTPEFPTLNRSDAETILREDRPAGSPLSREAIWELLHTPAYNTIQGERWQFCCQRPMIFVGEWSRDEFSRRSPDGDGRGFFHDIVQEPVPGLWEDVLHDATGVYVFRCPTCGRLTAHWDMY